MLLDLRTVHPYPHATTPATTTVGNTGNPSMTPTGPQASSTAHSDVELEGTLFKSREHTKTRKVEIKYLFYSEIVQVLLLSIDQLHMLASSTTERLMYSHILALLFHAVVIGNIYRSGGR